ncbi:10931_t:CDS:1, partial [Funneliformis mosseae]
GVSHLLKKAMDQSQLLGRALKIAWRRLRPTRRSTSHFSKQCKLSIF